MSRNPLFQSANILEYGTPLCLGLLLALLPGVSSGQELYVSDHREVEVWTGPGPDHNAFVTLKTGDAAQLVHREGEYYLVVIPDGRRGYVLQRDLTQEAPATFRLRQLEAEIERQAEEIGQLRKDNVELSAAANAQADREAQIKAELERLQSERSQIEYTRNLSWFLAGAGVLLTGWLIGWRFKLRDRTRGQGLRFS